MASRNDHRDTRTSSARETTDAAQHRHDALMRVYQASQAPSTTTSATPTIAHHDLAVLQRHFQFIRDEEADLERGARDWEVRMSVRYYRKLFREYALADLSRYKDSKVGLRWRTEMEVVAGKGQFICGNKVCDFRQNLHSYELLFAYMEHGEKKRCLVKVRVCEACARKLFYQKLKEKEKAERKKRRVEDKRDHEQHGADTKRKRRHRSDSGDDEDKDKRPRKTRNRRVSRDEAATSIHAICAQINTQDTQAMHGDAADRDADKDSDDQDEKATPWKALLV